MKSIIQDEKQCFFCGNTQYLEEHHIMGGANRKNSEKYGLKVYLCGDFTKNQCHKGPMGPHQNEAYARYLHEIAQRHFERTHSRDEWMKIFGRNYLGD